MTLILNLKVGRYVIGRRLGEGAVGVVHLAVDTLTGHKKAIKIVPRGDCSDLSRLEVEIRVMMMLHHPNVVELEEVLEGDSHVYFVMEVLSLSLSLTLYLSFALTLLFSLSLTLSLSVAFSLSPSLSLYLQLCGGGSLAEYVKVKPLSESLARSYFGQLVQGMIYCHSQGPLSLSLSLSLLTHPSICPSYFSVFLSISSSPAGNTHLPLFLSLFHTHSHTHLRTR